MRRPHVLILLLAMLALIGCTGDPPMPSSSANAPALPADVFPALPDRGTGVETAVEAMAGDGETLMMVVTVDGRSSLPALRYSTDAGATWRDGVLSERAASETVVGEEAVGVAAVAQRGTERQWLALGSKDEALFAWTSTDAQTWERTPAVGIDARTGEQVSSVTGLSGGGFVAVGGRWRDDKTWPMAWTSPDGITWTARPIAGEGWLSEVSASGDRVVAVGYRELPKLTRGRSQLSLLFTSTDRGLGWRRSTVKEPATSGDYLSSLDQVVATDTGFVVGGSYYDGAQESYRPLLLTSGDLRSWKPTRRLPVAGEASGVDELLQVGSTTVAVQSVTKSGSKDELRVWYLFAGDPEWTPGAAPAVRQSAWTTAAAGIGDRAVFAVRIEGNPRRTQLWRFDSPARVGEISVEPPAGARSKVQPAGLFVADGRLAAHGTAQGAPGMWFANGTGFDAPSAIRIADDEYLDQIAWSPGGGYLATGQVDGDRAFVLHSGDGATWRRTAPTAFNRVAQYHRSYISGVTWADGRWVVVGNKTTNGSVRQSALAHTSSDGTSWAAGRPTKVIRRGDWYDRRDPLDDLHGLDDNSRGMTAVLGVDRGVVAVGVTGDGQRSRPAAWVSPDARSWRLVPLASAGYPEAAVSSVHRVGAVLLGFGWARAKAETRTVRAVWRSVDGGEHWTFTPFGGTHSGSLMTSGERDFVQVVLSDDHRTVTLWRSADGLTWSLSPVAVDGLADGMEASLGDALVHDGVLHLLVTVRNRLDAVTVVQRVPL